MFGRKKEAPKKPRPVGSLAQYGIFEVPEKIEDLGGFNDDDENDEDLEAELAALTASDNPVRPVRRKAPSVPKSNLDAMITESLKDVDEDDDDDDGEDDPDLLAELNAITGDEPTKEDTDMELPEAEEAEVPPAATAISDETKKLIEERLEMYKTAVQKAKEKNETGKMRRYQRGLKTLEEMSQSVNSGHAINNDDIPPILPPSALSDASPKPAEIPSAEIAVEEPPAEYAEAESPQSTKVSDEVINMIKKRQQEYKIAALAWKKAGNMDEAKKHITVVKQFDMVFKAIEDGVSEDIDLSLMPPTPVLPGVTQPEKQEAEIQHSMEESVANEESPPSGQEEDLGFALKSRLEVYRRTKVAAEEEGNTSKARRYGRICKQFEDALKLYAAGKPVPLDELPSPPGFPKLEMPSAKSPEPPKSPSSGEQPKTPMAPKRVAPSPPSGKQQTKASITRAEKQAMALEKRQRELKLAALKAKQDGDLELARDYLRQAKGIEPLINASKAGLPVDMNSIPLSPDSKSQLNSRGYDPRPDDDFTLVSREECVEAEGTDQQIYENMEKQLMKQIKWCLSTRDHCKALGDVPGYNRWERLALGYSGDLDFLRVRKRDALPPPQHHYEIKTYSIVQSCTDVNNSDIEISILRGVNYSKETDTYVIYEYPLSSDNHETNRTATVKSSSSPEYNAVFTLSDVIDRNNRQCQRVFKRHALKCQVWEKGCFINSNLCCCTCLSGFFRGDRLLGTVQVKLQPLQTQCTIHDSFPLMDGRKATGGKLEVKIRLRNPINAKQIEQITDKWLIIDH